MACHPSGVLVEIVGIAASNQGRNCEDHKCCGSLLETDVVVRFRTTQVVVNGKEEQAIAAYHVTGGIDRCRVGFLRKNLLRFKDQYDGGLAQVTEIFDDMSPSPGDREKVHRFRGYCRAVLIDAEYRNSPPPKKQRLQEEKEEEVAHDN